MYPLFLLVDFQKSSINQACLPCFFTSTKRLLFDLKRLLDKDAICKGLRLFLKKCKIRGQMCCLAAFRLASSKKASIRVLTKIIIISYLHTLKLNTTLIRKK